MSEVNEDASRIENLLCGEKLQRKRIEALMYHLKQSEYHMRIQIGVCTPEIVEVFSPFLGNIEVAIKGCQEYLKRSIGDDGCNLYPSACFF